MSNIIYFLLLLLLGCGAPQYQISERFDGNRFRNPKAQIEPLSFFELLVHVATGRTVDWPEDVALDRQLDLEREIASDEIVVTFVNHATVLIQVSGLNIITDPVWSKRVGPLNLFGPKRAREPGIAFDELPKIDVVLISHNHYDHLDLPTLGSLRERDDPLILVPLGDQGWLRKKGFSRAIELDWWSSVEHADATFTFTPAQHTSGRGLFDAKKSFWGSFMISRGEQRVFFGGDTAYESHFSEIRERLGAPDLALLPIGAYAPRERHRPFHMDPRDAVRAMVDLRATRAVGIHYGTFKLTNEKIDQPVVDLKKALHLYGLRDDMFEAVGEGRTRVYPSRSPGETRSLSAKSKAD